MRSLEIRSFDYKTWESVFWRLSNSLCVIHDGVILQKNGKMLQRRMKAQRKGAAAFTRHFWNSTKPYCAWFSTCAWDARSSCPAVSASTERKLSAADSPQDGRIPPFPFFDWEMTAMIQLM